MVKINSVEEKKNKIKNEILYLATKYFQLTCNKDNNVLPAKINYAGRIYDEKELCNLIDASLQFWLTYGKWSKQFENKLAKFLGIKHCILVNSGSSANLLAIASLTSSLLGKKRIKPGDEVITVATSFPTTIAPLVQYGAVPVFVDIELDTLNIDTSLLNKALSSKVKAVFIAHTLGNPFNINYVLNFCNKHNLWLIEDNCDSLGSKYNNKYTGTFGHIGTSSFYPPHHITMGEGGAVYTNDKLLHKIIVSLRDWGRDCICESGQDNKCGKRFSGKFGELPFGYDHKYVYSNFGYNLKATDMQAAIGCAQLEKLPSFIKKRKQNWNSLYLGLKKFKKYFRFSKPTKNSKPCWFGFTITLKENLQFNRSQIVNFLEKNGIQTRMLFAGNIIKQPCFNELRNQKKKYRICGELKNTDFIMNNTFWIGVYPGINELMIKKIINTISAFVATKSS